MKRYAIKEIHYTLQGEGFHSGRPAVFCRFSGCNLWSGREEDRSKAICKFCDTDFWGTDGMLGGKYTTQELVDQIVQLFPDEEERMLVCTGGEPLLQLDEALIVSLHKADIFVAIETNGTILVPDGVDWVCMSPKANSDIIVTSGNEIKIIYPQSGINPKNFLTFDFEHYFIQPMDSPKLEEHISLSIQYCLENPKWKLSLQTHKLLGID